MGHITILVLRQGISLVLGAPRVKKEAEDTIENWWHRIDWVAASINEAMEEGMSHYAAYTPYQLISYKTWKTCT